MTDIRDGFGLASAGKYGYQASRAARGLGTTTALTAGLDLASGTTGVGGATLATDAAGSLSTTAKGVTGAAKISNAARIAGWASKAAPVVAKGSAVLGVALGGFEVGQGINDLANGRSSAGRDKVISGGADMVTAGALGVAAVSSGTVVGLPVAAVALGVAGAAQAGKYAWKYRENIADGAGWVADKAGEAAGWVGDRARDAGGAIAGAVGSLKDALF